jgi:hypothetical protein
MAIARCEICGPPRGKKYDYTHAHTLLSSPSSNMICAGPGCVRLLSITWLTDEEERQYLRGQRFFRIGRKGQVRVT